jgi:hypothetical protein
VVKVLSVVSGFDGVGDGFEVVMVAKMVTVLTVAQWWQC